MLIYVSKGIDGFNKKLGEASSLLAIPLLAVVIYEVFMRYVFNKPTVWGFEVTTFLYAFHYMLGLSYCERMNGHVQVDIFSSRLPLKAQAVLNIISYTVLFIPVNFLLFQYSWKFAWTSWLGREVSWTSWAPPIYPVKMLMAFCFLVLLLQGISMIIKQIYILAGKSDNPS
jgi:TRAP-type mannitol/chloroaromatic compound transport system permease small subunit